MEDIIQKYKKEQKIKNISIVITSLALALGLNIFLSSTDSGKYLKASVINSQVAVEKKSDLYFETVKNSGNIVVYMKTSKEINKAQSLSFSLAYNKENVSIKDKKLNIDGGEILNLVDNDGYNTLIVNFKNPTNIKAGEVVFEVVVEKKDAKDENINLVNANITDADNNLFMLSTSGAKF